MSKSAKAGISLLALCFLICVASSAHASTFFIPSDDDLIIGARAIVRGKVLSVSCQVDEQTGRIFTYVRVRVRQVLKGEIGEPEIVLKEQGGRAGDRGSVIFGSPQFAAGERVVLYLDTRRDGSLRVHQMFLGKFSIISNPATGERAVVRDTGGKNITVLQRDAGGEAVATSRMELSAYLDMVQRRAEVNRERSEGFAGTYYKATPLLAEPTEYNRISSGDEIAPDFILIAPPARWFEPDTGEIVHYWVNTEGAPSAQIVDDVSAATNAWSSVPGCALRLNNDGATGACYSGQNTVVFNNCDGQFSPSPSCGGILALGGVDYSYNQTKVINGTTFVRVYAGHISFNPYASCFFTDRCRVQEIATHEMGHTIGLGHSQFSDATMSATAHFDGRCASLRQDDSNAALFVYPAGGGGGGPLAIQTTSPLGNATTGLPFSRQLAASGGTTPYTWSLVSGSSLPGGLSLSQSGLISGTPAAAGTFSFTVKVTDAVGGTAEKSLSMTVSDPSSGYDSQFVSQTVPSTLGPGLTFFATIRWVNTGTRTWDGAGGFSIQSQNPSNNGTWGGSQVPWFNAPVAPGQQMELLFQATAPSTPGTYNFQWQLYQQGAGLFGQMSANVSITVGDGGAPVPLSINSVSSLSAVTGTFLTYIPTASGGTPPYSWQIAAGTLPAGIFLSAGTGTLTGTPTITGVSNVTLQVTDSRTAAAQKALTITVTGPPLTVSTSSLPSAIKGVSFNQPLTATGGKPPYAWAISGGGLPGGLSLSSTGLISGAPTATGSFTFAATATDANLQTANKTLTLTVIAPPLSIATVPVLEMAQAASFGYQLNASGGTPPYTWSITTGTLPAGLMLSSAGFISGAPTVLGSSSVTVTVRDQASVQTAASVQMRVLDPATIPAIRKVKYKNSNKLTVNGERVNPAAVLLIDGTLTPAVSSEDQFILKPLALAPGRHEIRIVNPGAVSSLPFMLDVEGP